jgi:glycosyltransferase involved in cell wall biosynthesis
MNEFKKIFIVAFSVYPNIKSSEGIVNINWINIIKKRTNVYLISAWDSIIWSTKNSFLSGKKIYFLKYVYILSTNKKKSIDTILYKILNKLIIHFSTLNFFQNCWVYFQTKRILKISKLESNYVFWLRILPVWPIISILKAHAKRPFPLITNCNDPISSEFEEDYYFRKSIIKTQCWTFPSNKLADFFSEKYLLERDRCFVIPHAMKNQDILFNSNFDKIKKLQFLYTGTFYKSSFSEMFKQQLKIFGQSLNSNKVEFKFILSQYDQESINWLKEALPNATLMFKLERDELLEHTKNSDCIFVVDSESHSHLLKGKLIEAFSFGIPVFGITYRDSVLDQLIVKYGSISSFQNVENDIFYKLNEMVQSLNDYNWRIKFCNERVKIMNLISEETISKLTSSINEFAYNRFLWEQKKTAIYPKQPWSIEWP